MKITDKTSTKMIHFTSLDNGSFFKDENGVVCMKFPNVVYEDNDDKNSESYNAYDFTRNVFTWYDSFDCVEQVSAELVLNKYFT